MKPSTDGWTAEKILRDRELCLDEASQDRLQQAVRITKFSSISLEPDGPDDNIPLFEYLLPDGEIWIEVFCGRGLYLTTENVTALKKAQVSEVLPHAGKTSKN